MQCKDPCWAPLSLWGHCILYRQLLLLQQVFMQGKAPQFKILFIACGCSSKELIILMALRGVPYTTYNDLGHGRHSVVICTGTLLHEIGLGIMKKVPYDGTLQLGVMRMVPYDGTYVWGSTSHGLTLKDPFLFFFFFSDREILSCYLCWMTVSDKGSAFSKWSNQQQR